MKPIQALCVCLFLLSTTTSNCQPNRRLLQEENADALRLAELSASGPLSELRRLIRAGVDPDLRYNGTPALWRAAARNNRQAVRFLVRQGAEINAQNRNGTTALYIAAQRGYQQIVDFLVESGAELEVESSWGSTALAVSVDNDHTEVATGLIEAGANFEKLKDASGQSALWTAAHNGNREIVEVLLEAGADVNHTDEAGTSPLYAAVTHNHPEIVELLLRAAADPVPQKDGGNTPLHSASANCFTEATSLLLEFGAGREIRNDNDLRPVDVSCLTEVEDSVLRQNVEDLLCPLIGAARAGNMTAVEELLVLGEDVNDQLRSGRTALMWAALSNNGEIISILLDAEAERNLVDNSRWTALHFASSNNSIEAIRALNGSDPNLLNEDSNTPLMIAVIQSEPRLETVEALLSIGSDVNYQSENGDTAFHKAARYGNEEILVALRNAEADWSIENEQGERPVDVVGEETEITEEEILQLQSLMRDEVETVNGNQERERRISNRILPVEIEDQDDDDDDDTFSTGEILAFLMVPCVTLVVCVGAIILHFRAHEKALQAPKKQDREIPSSLFPEPVYQGKALGAIDHFARRTERDIPTPVAPPDAGISVESLGNKFAVSFEPREYTKDEFSAAERVGEWVGTSTAASHRASSSTQAVRNEEITAEQPEGVVAFTHRRSNTETGEIEETPRMPTKKKLDSPLVSQESDEFYDAKEKLSGSVIMSSTQSDEFRDALERQGSYSLSSEKMSGYQSAAEEPVGSSSSEQKTSQTYGTPEGTIPTTDVSVRSAETQEEQIPSFPVQALTETISSESQRGSSEAAVQDLLQGVSGTGSTVAEATIPAVEQSTPEPPARLTSFALNTFSDTASESSRRLSKDEWSTTDQTVLSSPNVSLEIPPPPPPTEGAPVIQATDVPTEGGQRVESFAISTFGSTVSTMSQRASNESRGLSLDRPPAPVPPGSSDEPSSSLNPHPIDPLLSSASSIESQETRSEPGRFVGYHPTSNIRKP